MRPQRLSWHTRLLWPICLACILFFVNATSASADNVLHAAPPPAPPGGTPPPLFDPAQLDPGQPLPGAGYPTLRAMSPAAASPVSAGRPEGIDLDILFIERTPKYERYAVHYQDGLPLLSPDMAAARRWPAPGETVTFLAHVMNKGTQYAGSFGIAWYIDGKLVKTDKTQSALWPHTRAIFELPWAWDHGLAGDRLTGAHTVRVVVDPDQQVAETFENNNELEDRTDALALELVVSPQAYGALNNEPQPGRSFSAEDWLQRHVQAFNEALAAAIYPTTPNGVDVRLRIDKIRIAWDQPLVDLRYDGGWFVYEDYRTSSIYYHADEDLDWGMLHEWGHQVGLIDTYRYLVMAESIDVRRQDGSSFAAGYDFPGDGLMETVNSKQVDALNAAGLQATQGYRRGYYGEYQFDLPAALVLALVDAQGCPVPDAAVSFYQRDPAVDELNSYRRIDNQPEFTGMTDAAGRFQLPNRSSGGPQTTATGFTLHDNPFGLIEVVGSGNLGLLKVQRPGYEQFSWLTVADINLSHWLQGKPPVQEVTLTWGAANDPANCLPSATPTPTPAPVPVVTPTPPATPTSGPVIAPNLPLAPGDVAAQVYDRTQVTVRWTDRSNNEIEYLIWRSQDGGASWQPVASVAAGSQSWTDHAAACDQRYLYRVAAGNSQGHTAAAAEPAATTALCPESAPGEFGAQPGGQAGASQTLSLAWLDASIWEDGFRIEWAINSAGWTPLAEVGAGVTAFTTGKLACGAVYRLRVYAFNSAGASGSSTELVYTAPACPIALNKLYLPLVLGMR